MSARSTCRSRPGQRMYKGGFTSISMASYTIPRVSTGVTNVAPITAVTINRSLLQPLNIDIDPSIHTVRSHEKDQIKSLNNQFVTFIDKVRCLEQQNKMLETKWTLLQQQSEPSSEVEPMLRSYIARLQHQLETLNDDTHILDVEKKSMVDCVEDYRNKYECEIHKRNDAESEFVLLKKDVDLSYLTRMDREGTVSSITEEFNFLRAVYDVELREHHESLKETSVVVQMDNSRRLNMEKIISEVKAQYEESFTHSREETESWYRSKFDQVSANANQYDMEVRRAKSEISELNQMIRRLQNEIQAVKAQDASLEDQIEKAELFGEAAVQDAWARIKDLDMALLRAKQDMARQVREYQELLNVKLALDMEISTYMKLLEGEEEILGKGPRVFTPSVCSPTNHPQQPRKGTILIKTVEIHGN